MAIWPYLLFGFVAGAMLPIQFGINAQLATWVDSPLRATLISFAVGTVALFVVVLARVSGRGRGPSTTRPHRSQSTARGAAHP